MAVFYNQATLSYAGGTVRSNLVSGEIAEALTLTKTPISGSYSSGGTVAYAIGIANVGDAAVSGVTLTDDLGGYTFDTQTVYPLAYRNGSLLAFVNGAPAAAPSVTAGPPLTVSGIDVPANGSVLLVYEALVTPYAPLGESAQITNTAELSGGGIAAALSASATLAAQPQTQFAITKFVDPDTVSSGNALTYTFILQNFGDAQAVVVSDTFDPILTGISATLNGAAFAAYTYEADSGVFTTVEGAVTVPAASHAQSPDGSWAATPGVAVLTVTGTI